MGGGRSGTPPSSPSQGQAPLSRMAARARPRLDVKSDFGYRKEAIVGCGIGVARGEGLPRRGRCFDARGRNALGSIEGPAGHNA